MKKSNTIMLGISLVISMFIFSGCAVVQSAINRDNIDCLKEGMTKRKASKLLGVPNKKKVDANSEYWFYYTGDYPSDWGQDKNSFTPVVFIDNKVAGWGMEYYNKQKEMIKQYGMRE